MPRLLPRLRLPGPTVTRSRRVAARRAVLRGLIVFLTVNLGIGLATEVYPRLRDPMFGDKLVKLQKRYDASRPLAVVLGTSRAGMGVHGAHAERVYLERTGHAATVFNLGVPATGPVAHLVYLNRLLESGPTPDLLVIEVLPSMCADLPTGPYERPFLPGDRLTGRELVTVERFGFRPDEVRPAWLRSTLLPAFGLRFQILGRLGQSWLPFHLRHDWGRTTDPHGWGTALRDVATVDERTNGAARARAEYAAVLGTLTPGGPAGEAVREMLRVCRDRGVPAKLLWMPEATDFRALYPPDAEQRMTAFLGSLRTEFGVDVIDARGWVPDHEFTDGHHLLRPGAERFSGRLADEVLVPAFAPWRGR